MCFPKHSSWWKWENSLPSLTLAWVLEKETEPRERLSRWLGKTHETMKHMRRSKTIMHVATCTLYMMFLLPSPFSLPHFLPLSLSSESSEGPAPKKPRTTNVVVEQAGQSDKLLIDQIADTDSVFDEVCVGSDSCCSRIMNHYCHWTCLTKYLVTSAHDTLWMSLSVSESDSAVCLVWLARSDTGSVSNLLDQAVTVISSQSDEWPFSWFCEEMFRNLINPAWEVW